MTANLHLKEQDDFVMPWARRATGWLIHGLADSAHNEHGSSADHPHHRLGEITVGIRVVIRILRHTTTKWMNADVQSSALKVKAQQGHQFTTKLLLFCDG